MRVQDIESKFNCIFFFTLLLLFILFPFSLYDRKVLDTLTTYDNIITPDDYQNSSTQMKKTFTGLSRDLLVAMCKNVAYGQASLYTSSKLVILSAQKRGFDNVTTDEFEMPCGLNCTTEAAVLLGQEMEDNYKSWSCSAETCTGMDDADWLHIFADYTFFYTIMKPLVWVVDLEWVRGLVVSNVECEFGDSSSIPTVGL